MTITMDETAITGTVNAVSGSACPSWCTVEDHDDFDGGKMHHVGSDTVELSAYSYEVNGKSYHDLMYVCREQVRDGAPVIVLDVPTRAPGGVTLPDGGTVSGAAVLTIEEAAELVAALHRAINAETFPR